MTRIEQLTAIRDAVRDGVWPGWADTPMGWDTNLLWKAFNGSVDAALALFAALLPGSLVHDMSQYPDEWHVTIACSIAPHYFSAKATDLARALTLAVLEALIAKEEG